MTALRMIELAAAVIMLGLAVWLYRRPRPKGDVDGYGSQGAVILIVVAIILGIHALGGMDYRPSQSELEMMRSQ
jgi:hypothetical protein